MNFKKPRGFLIKLYYSEAIIYQKTDLYQLTTKTLDHSDLKKYLLMKVSKKRIRTNLPKISLK